MIIAIGVRFAMIPTKALAIEENTSNNIPVCVEDKRHIIQTDDMQVNESVEAEKHKEDENLSQKEKQIVLGQNFSYVAIDPMPIEKIISDSYRYVTKEYMDESAPKLPTDQRIHEASRRKKSKDYVNYVSKTNKVNESTFQTLNKDLNDRTATVAKQDKIILKQQGEILNKDEIIFKQKQELEIKDSALKQATENSLETNKLKNEETNINIDGQEKINTVTIRKINIEDLDPIQRAYLNYPTKEDEIFLINGELLRSEKKTSPRQLKGKAFTGPIEGKIRIRYDLQISTETEDNKATYQTTTQFC